MFLNKGPMVDICPIWTVMVISISTIARIMAAYFGSKPSISAIPASMGIPGSNNGDFRIAKNIGQLFKSCLV
jgi:hypothetical protein